MINRLTAHIAAYTDHLRRQGLCITLHGRVQEYAEALAPYNFHYCPYCVLVKTDSSAWERCIAAQKKIYAQKSREPWLGMCHAGVEEYIFPLWTDRMVGFISVSGYGADRESAEKRIARLGRDFSLNEARLREVYRTQLSHEIPDLAELSVIIAPLCDMLLFLYMLTPPREKLSCGSDVYETALRYIGRHFMEELTVAAIAQACHCSESTLSHVFRRHSGMSVGQYTKQLRLDQAAKLLRTTKLPVKNIAALCGYGDPDYFCRAFRKSRHVSPTQYRLDN